MVITESGLLVCYLPTDQQFTGYKRRFLMTRTVESNLRKWTPCPNTACLFILFYKSLKTTIYKRCRVSNQNWLDILVIANKQKVYIWAGYNI